MTKHAAPTFAPGDRVEWNIPQGPTRGRVIRKLTARTEIKDHDVAAAPENLQYLVVSDESGAEAAHKPEALQKPT